MRLNPSAGLGETTFKATSAQSVVAARFTWVPMLIHKESLADYKKICQPCFGLVLLTHEEDETKARGIYRYTDRKI